MKRKPPHKALRFEIKGRVQGIGFRPFIYRLATSLQLKGWVRNTSEGVLLEVVGDTQALDEFHQRLKADAPPLSQIEEMVLRPAEPASYQEFVIEKSLIKDEPLVQVQPDLATCSDCLRELHAPDDRRFLYPFLNCINCGPRFTIIRDVPYDRKNTTMAPFEMCPDCRREYQNPLDRRYHAQPTACPRCGPRLSLLDPEGNQLSVEQPFEFIREQLVQGKILAIKGLGGYHLACDALQEEAVRRLRQRKYREDKPFALMLPDLETVEKYCLLDEAERDSLLSFRRPIVLLRRRPQSPIASEVAPHNPYLGVMLPYTPLHHLLFSEPIEALVMTSGNLSQEPIAYKDADALKRLKKIADYFVLHNREIERRCDDSVVRSFRSREYLFRRARSYAPVPIKLGFSAPPILAVGAELKNTFCMSKADFAYLSHHLGDLENLEAYEAFTQGIEDFKRLFRLQPQLIVHDLHPRYLSTQYALEQEGIEKLGVQHHFAHIAACLAENHYHQPVIGMALDGVGLGDDQTIWGGEVLIADLTHYRRFAALKTFPLPSSEMAIKQPWRTALSYLWQIFGSEWEHAHPQFASQLEPHKAAAIIQLINKGINSPLCSSLGRLFDAVSALLGLRQQINYEGQAAMELEYLATSSAAPESYHFTVQPSPMLLEIDPSPTVEEVISELNKGESRADIARRFHNTIIEIIIQLAERARAETGLKTVALSGGCFQNFLLLEGGVEKLEAKGFNILLHRQLPPNDGCISLGQLAIAAHIC